MRIVAFYLPQFHEIVENNVMWGEGFTDWKSVRNARKYYVWHEQPVEPLNDYYYCLLDEKVMEWQVNLAKEHGIYGFCVYHYWYNGKLLLEKPLELFLKNKNIDFPFCICWANHDWGYSWVRSDDIIYEQKYDDEAEWKDHFQYLLPFFKDKRYIQNNGKPLVVIYDPSRDKRISKMLRMWNEMAIENGLEGLSFAYQSSFPDTQSFFDDSVFDYDIEYQPMYARTILNKNKTIMHLKSIFRHINRMTINIRNADLPDWSKQKKPKIYDYDELYRRIITSKPVKEKAIAGFFINEDTTPRKQERGFIVKGMTVEKFKYYFKKQVLHVKREYASDFLFGFAWNEWAEGAYMEPDKKNGFGVLDAIKQVLIELDEWPT